MRYGFAHNTAEEHALSLWLEHIFFGNYGVGTRNPIDDACCDADNKLRADALAALECVRVKKGQ